MPRQFFEHESLYIDACVGFRSSWLDLKQPEGRERALELARRADVFDGGVDADRRPARGGHPGIRRHARVLPALHARRSGLAESFVHRAEAAGFKGIVVTLDTWVAGWRPRDLTLSSFPQLRGYCLANYFSDPVFRSRLAKPPEEDPASAVRHWTEIFGTTLTWADLPWLRSLTKLPLLLKGICHPDDVRRAIDGGVDGIYCSTHGGRQANGGVGCLDMLPAVVEAAGKTPVLFDSGVRSGSDIVKALALGATAVGIGRPYAWGLALDGTDGIVHVLRCLLAEADLLMAIDGYPTIEDLRSGAMMRS